ncbi:MAG: sensor histidine kinase [Burkholderiaceae bacterium]
MKLRRPSLRSQLLLGILLPVLGLVALNTVSLYREALRSANTAYDRTLLASAKVIGEQLEVEGRGTQARLRATVPYSALEAFDADNRSQMFYKVSGFDGEMVSGYEDLPRWTGRIPDRGPYAALVDFYDEQFRGRPVRVAVLLQPVAGSGGQGMATIQVAETLELRETLARQLLMDTLWRQALLLAVIAAVVTLVVQRATRPVRALSAAIRARDATDLSPIEASTAPRELLPLVDATNQVMARLAHLLEQQKRFVRDTAHQLRTPLAVLRTQTQSSLRGDVAPLQALREIDHTVQRATQLANQMLSLAKVEQLRQQGDATVLDWAGIVREVALDLGPLIAEKRLDFAISTEPAPVRAHDWALRELSRNLLHNAWKFSSDGAMLAVRLRRDGGVAELTVSDGGPGLPRPLQHALFQPFATGRSPGDGRAGSGLGLAICQEIVRALGGHLVLRNRGEPVQGLDALVRLPLADNPP